MPQASSHSEWFQLAPAGDQLAWIGRSREGVRSLWVRSLAEREERQLAGTEGVIQPFWSADGRWLGFFADGKLKKAPVAGGPPVVLATAASPWGGAWSRDGVIVFSSGLLGRIYRVAADGGEVTPLTELAPEEEAHRWPCFLPDDEHFAFLADSAQAEHHQIRLGSLAGGPAPPLVQAVSQPACVERHLLYVRSGTLLAQKVDVRGARLEGEPTPVALNLDENYPNHHFELSAVAGLLAYRSVDPATRFVWIDRRGRVLETVGEPGRYGSFELSRDERRLAYARYDTDGRVEGVWWRDLHRGIVARVAATSERALVGFPVWSPDATQLALGVATTGPWSLGAVRIGDPAPPRPLLQTAVDDLPASWSPDGRWLAFGRSERQEEDSHIWVASLADGSATPFTRDDSNEIHPAFSPDGRWIAYAADPSGRREVYLRRFPEGGPAIPVSRAGGGLPAWRGDGRELYYVSRDLELVAVPLAGPPSSLTPGEPEVLFELEAGDHPQVWWEGVAPARDGSRFLALEHVASPARQPIRLIVGWQPP
jgi:Tol biopolymer transport system component